MKDCSPLRADDLFKLHLAHGFPEDFDANAYTAITTTASVYDKLCSLNPAKAPCPDGISNWIFKEYAELEVLAFPISCMLNTSFHA